MYAPEYIEQIRQIPVLEFISKYVTLRRHGAMYRGLCPLHNEKTPSFYVNSAKNNYKCYGCDTGGGNIIDFYTQLHHTDFNQTIEELTRLYNLEPRYTNPEITVKKNSKKTLYEANSIANNFFLQELSEGKGSEYWHTRKFDSEITNVFSIGYTNGSGLIEYCHNHGLSYDTMIDAGLIYQSDSGQYRTHFNNRIMFPIRDILGRITGFSGRSTLPTELQKKNGIVKYKNTPETEIYKKSNTLYGLYENQKKIRELGTALIFEGQTDIMAAHTMGLPALCAMGTAITDQQCRLIHRYTDDVTLVFDNDAAGLRAMRSTFERMLEENLAPYCLSITGVKDFDELRLTGHAMTIDNITSQRREYIATLIRITAPIIQAQPHRQSEIINGIITMITRIPDPVRQQLYYDQLTRSFPFIQAGIQKNYKKKSLTHTQVVSDIDILHTAAMSEEFLSTCHPSDREKITSNYEELSAAGIILNPQVIDITELRTPDIMEIIQKLQIKMLKRLIHKELESEIPNFDKLKKLIKLKEEIARNIGHINLGDAL